jgi:hypothetical protein
LQWNRRRFDIGEVLVYVDPVHRGRGIDRAHPKLEPELVGTIRDAAHKFDQWMDITVIQLVLEKLS